MKIQVLGTGCKKCKELYERTQKALQSIDDTLTVEYVTDVQKIVEMGMLSTPVLAINSKPILVGILPEIEKIKEVLTEHLSDTPTEPKEGKNACSNCSCGGMC